MKRLLKFNEMSSSDKIRTNEEINKKKEEIISYLHDLKSDFNSIKYRNFRTYDQKDEYEDMIELSIRVAMSNLSTLNWVSPPDEKQNLPVGYLFSLKEEKELGLKTVNDIKKKKKEILKELNSIDYEIEKIKGNGRYTRMAIKMATEDLRLLDWVLLKEDSF